MTRGSFRLVEGEDFVVAGSENEIADTAAEGDDGAVDGADLERGLHNDSVLAADSIRL